MSGKTKLFDCTFEAYRPLAYGRSTTLTPLPLNNRAISRSETYADILPRAWAISERQHLIATERFNEVAPCTVPWVLVVVGIQPIKLIDNEAIKNREPRPGHR